MVGNISQKSLNVLSAIMKQAKFDAKSNTDEQALETQALYPDWKDLEDEYSFTAGERVNYLDILYKVILGHQKQHQWNPVDSPSLFAKVLIIDENSIPDWEQPDSTNAFMKGDKVIHNKSTWESLVDNNVWEPGAVGTESLWKKLD